jgi:DNA modification methylase
LRDYGTATWAGGEADCKHSVREERGFEKWKQSSNRGNSKPPKKVCPKCGAVRIDNQIGLEDTPEDYISKMVEVFTEVYRVLKPAGTLWLNIGDSYWGGKGYSGASAEIYRHERRKACKSINSAASCFTGYGAIRPTDKKHHCIKSKDLIGIPWMLAFALRNFGWFLRQDIIWHKPNPMPESVKDRCTKSHEYIFLLSKNTTTFNVQSFAHKGHERRANKIRGYAAKGGDTGLRPDNHGSNIPSLPARNKRDVWTVCTQSEPEAHFACFPQILIADCVKAGCPEGGIVLDPFMGSGTTAVVSRKLGRNYVGFELNPKYINISERKLNRELGIFR